MIVYSSSGLNSCCKVVALWKLLASSAVVKGACRCLSLQTSIAKHSLVS